MDEEIRPEYYNAGKIEVIDFIIDYHLDFAIKEVSE